MRVLIVTQAVDSADPYLSFFEQWLKAFSKRFERIHVICLKEGEHALPPNVHVHSLGKERGAGRIAYVRTFFNLVWQLRGEYDTVFVHMNQEYVLLGGVLWRILRKRVYLWRNHYSGTVLTALAVALSYRVFCTSRFSYTARFKRTRLMPVGVDTDFFRPVEGVARMPRSILFYGRLAPSKNPGLLLDALGILQDQGVSYTATIRGTPLPNDESFADSLKRQTQERGLSSVVFEPGLPHRKGPEIFSAAEIYVNLAGSGMYDKTIFEAAACGALSLACSRDYAELVPDVLYFEAGNAAQLAERLHALLNMPLHDREQLAASIRSLVHSRHSLSALTEALAESMG